MWAYGTSGTLIKIGDAPTKKEGRLPLPEEGYYYAIDLRENANELLEANPEYYGRIVVAVYRGIGKNGRKIYYFSTPAGIDVIPITDDMGREGTVIIKEDCGHNKQRTRTVYAT